VLLAAYSRVRGSQARRTITTRHRALLACRSPPRSSRWRTVLPEEAESGATPHRRAKLASLRSRCGLSPAATSSAPATSVPTPSGRGQLRCGLDDQPVQLGIQPADLGGKGQPTAGQLAHGQLGRRQRRGKRPRPEAGRTGDQRLDRQGADLGAERLGGGDDQVVELVGGLGAGEYRAQLYTCRM
jgi:hypothetical protein